MWIHTLHLHKHVLWRTQSANHLLWWHKFSFGHTHNKSRSRGNSKIWKKMVVHRDLSILSRSEISDMNVLDVIFFLILPGVSIFSWCNGVITCRVNPWTLQKLNCAKTWIYDQKKCWKNDIWDEINWKSSWSQAEISAMSNVLRKYIGLKKS